MIRSLIYVIIIALGGMFAPQIAENKGYIFINFGSASLETSILAVLIIAIVVFYVLKILITIIKSPYILSVKSKNKLFEFKSEQQLSYIEKLLINIYHQDWLQVEKYIGNINKSEQNVSYYLFLAKTYHETQRYKKRDKCIKELEQLDEKFDTSKIKFEFLKTMDRATAETYIKELKVNPDSHQRDLNLVARYYIDLKKYHKLINILDKLKQIPSIDKADLEKIEIAKDLTSLRQAESTDAVEAAWSNLGIFKRYKQQYKNCYIQMISKFDPLKAAIEINQNLSTSNPELTEIARANLHWNPEQEPNLHKIYNKHKNNVSVCMVLVDIFCAAEKYDVAEKMIPRSICPKTNKKYLHKIGFVLEKQNKFEEAIKYYKMSL